MKENKDRVEGNKLIAEFTGYYVAEFNGAYHFVCKEKKKPQDRNQAWEFRLEEAKYHSSWDWLMPIVKKCFKKSFEISSGKRAAGDSINKYKRLNIEEGLRDVDIEKTWQAVVSFIQRYKKQGHTPSQPEPTPTEKGEDCTVCGGDGRETCNNPDHGFIDAVGHELGRLGCPGCGHDPKHKAPNGGICEACGGTGKEPQEDKEEELIKLLWDKRIENLLTEATGDTSTTRGIYRLSLKEGVRELLTTHFLTTKETP